MCRSRTSPRAERGSPSATTVSRSSPSMAARRGCSSRTSTSGRAPSGCAVCNFRRTTSRASGRSTATTTTEIHGRNSGTGATELEGRGGRRRRRGDAARQDDPLRDPRLGGPPRRPARRRPPDRRGWLPGAAQLLDRVAAGRHSRRADRRAAGGRRGLAVSDRRAPAGRPDRAAGPRRRLLRRGAAAGRAAAPRRRRLGRRAADGDDPAARRRRQRRRHPPPFLLTQLGGVIYRDELERLEGGGLRVVHTLTRSPPADWTGYARRVDAEILAEGGPGPTERPRVYVCGPTLFVEAVAQALVQLGHEPHMVKTERFGPTGG